MQAENIGFNMKSHDLNWKVAEALGWKKHLRDKWIVINPKYPLSVQPLNTIPDFSGDLNAMHEAEKVLTTLQKYQYVELLGDFSTYEKGEYPTFRFLTATATQRANAFLKSI
jgi:hypothetical protein